MASIREVKRLLAPIVDRHDDLAIAGRYLLIKPARHHIRAVLIDRTSSANQIRPHWFVHHLFSPRLSPHISWGADLYRSRPNLWRMDDPDMQSDLIQQIETVALPILRQVETLDDFIGTIMTRWGGHHLVNDDWTRIAVELAMGNVELALELCTDRICGYPDPGPKEAPVWRNEVAGTKELCRLLRTGDVPGAIEKLHDFERQTVKNLKIESFWEPTPFPVETMQKAS